MAGLGSRFAENGYTKPKPLIDVDGEPMIKKVIDSLNVDGNYIFIVQREHSVNYHLQDVLDEFVPGCTIVEIDGVTDGAARTTLLAKDLIDNDINIDFDYFCNCFKYENNCRHVETPTLYFKNN
jgi:NDP-sugar pyrophosphorylase family protein